MTTNQTASNTVDRTPTGNLTSKMITNTMATRKAPVAGVWNDPSVTTNQTSTHKAPVAGVWIDHSSNDEMTTNQTPTGNVTIKMNTNTAATRKAPVQVGV